MNRIDAFFLSRVSEVLPVRCLVELALDYLGAHRATWAQFREHESFRTVHTVVAVAEVAQIVLAYAAPLREL